MGLETLLSAEEAIEYVKANTDVFSKSEKLQAQVLAGESMSVDGLANQVLRVQSKEGTPSVIVKQILPFVRTLKEKGVDLPLSLKRMEADVQYMRVVQQVCPELAIKVEFLDTENNILVMEDLRDMKILRYELIQGHKLVEFPKKMGDFLGRMAYLTSKYHLNHWEKTSFDQFFSDNYDDGIWKELIFDSLTWEVNQRQINPLIQKDMLKLSQDQKIFRHSRELKSAFFHQHQCLVHTDLHSSNVFVSEDRLKIFDSEYARYGPVGYDLAQIMGSLLLNYASLFGYRAWSDEKKEDYQAYLLDAIQTIYHTFEDTYFSLWEEGSLKDDDEKARRRKVILRHTLGFMACASMQRIYDDILCLAFKRMDNLQDRAIGQGFVIEIAAKLMHKCHEYEHMEGVIADIRSMAMKYKK